MFWTNSTGAARTIDGEWVRYGLVGSSDILGVVNGGYLVCIEVKTGLSTQSEQQLKFEAAIKKRGGHYFVARSVMETLEFVSQVAASRNVG